MTDNIQTQDILKKIVSQFGRQIFDKSESRHLEGTLSDYMTDDRALQKLLRLAIRDGIAHDLLQCDALDRSATEIKISSLKVKFKEENSLEKSKACFVVDCFAYALGFITNMQEVNPDNFSPADEEADDFAGSLTSITRNGKWGYIDRDKHEVIPLKYDKAWSFNADLQGLALVELDGKCHYIDRNGNRWKYEEAHGIKEGLAAVMQNGKWGYIDGDGNEVIPCKYDGTGSFYEGFAVVKLNEKYGFINTAGREIIPFKYNNAYFFSGGRAAVQLNFKWGFIDMEGNEVIPLKYDTVFFFTEGLAAVELNGKWGFIDTAGNEIIPLKYDNAFVFICGTATVELNGKEFDIDKTGNYVNG
jgi:hypothetical protein